MPGYVPVDPPMHRHHGNVHLLLNAGNKEGVDELLHWHFARSNEEESWRPLFQEQFFERRQLVENRFPDFGRQPACKAFEPFSDMKKGCLIHFPIGGQPRRYKTELSIQSEKSESRKSFPFASCVLIKQS